MLLKYTVFLSFFLATGPIYGLNNLHDASYGLIPRRSITQGYLVSFGIYLFPQKSSGVAIPVSAGMNISRNLEIGCGLKTRWRDTDNHIEHGVIGLRYNLKGSFVLQGDLLFGIDHPSSGMSIGFLKRRSINRKLYSWFTGKLGFFEYLSNDDAMMSMELAYYPTLKLTSSLFLEMGIMASSQTKEFEDNLAIDFQPGFRIPLPQRLVFNVTATLGLAGNKQEDVRVNTNIYKRFP